MHSNHSITICSIKIRFDDEQFVVNGALLKKYYPSAPIPIFRKPGEDILVSDPSQDKKMEGEH